MDKTYTPSQFEDIIYKSWEEKGLLKAKVDKKKKPFSIILPPPNANGELHMGHAMYVYEDVMIRYHKLQGYETLWLPGADHAGIETQYVYEKHLRKEGKSRFDYNQETLYKLIWDFVEENRGKVEKQLKRLGFALDWSKEKYTLDPDIIKIVHRTFKKYHDDGLIYRAYRLVNYCTRDGTSFSDLEVVAKERQDPLYYMKYGPFTLATVRPETKFGDTAVAVNPKDKRYKEYIGREIEVEGLLGTFKMKVVGDEAVDPKFGTGVVKVTPAHDFNDFEIAKRHGLALKQVIGFDGKLNEETGRFSGLKVTKAREVVVDELRKKNLIEKIDEEYTHVVGTCYRCGNVLEPLPLEQWYINVKPLVTDAKKLVNKEQIKIYPKRFKKRLNDILDNFIDWNISRQIVWGIRIPAWQCTDCKEWIITQGETPSSCAHCKKSALVQDPDTFDTWFSSSQWPFATLETFGKEFYEYFYPTSVMETGYDILRAWVSRMIMMGSHVTGKVPFESVFLHGLVRDKQGAKMSKSKGNVINPLDMVDKYGADAFRASLLFNVKEGADVTLTEERIIGMRNFANKIWNIGRFINQTSNLKHQTGGRTSAVEERSGKTAEVTEVGQRI